MNLLSSMDAVGVPSKNTTMALVYIRPDLSITGPVDHPQFLASLWGCGSRNLGAVGHYEVTVILCFACPAF